MSKKPEIKTAFQSGSRAGEHYVWLTSMGLSLGLVLVVGLLLLILWEGITVFWPRTVVQYQLTDANAGIQGTTTVAGEVVDHRVKLNHVEGEKLQEEYQLYVGNKDHYGFNFKFLDAAVIKEATTPQDIFIAERVENGKLLGYPVELVMKDGTKIPVTAPEFAAKLNELVHAGNERRAKILTLEKYRIGAINEDMEELRIEEKIIRNNPQLTDAQEAERLAPLHTQEEKLKKDYDTLYTESQTLRNAQVGTDLIVRLPGGEVVKQSVGGLLEYYYPNQLSFFGRVGMFLHRMWTFVSDDPREANTEGGIFPAIFGTFVMTVLMSIAVTPFGVIAAVYLREYAKQGLLVQIVRICVNNLAGVPSIVYGVFGLGFFVYFIGGQIDQLFFSASLPSPTFGTGGIMWSALTLSLLTLPVVIVATEEAL
ncbi:MAG: phosphate ABC transporter, permease protein PstA, partial [Candidatus Methylacidiphilales bacterium]